MSNSRRSKENRLERLLDRHYQYEERPTVCLRSYCANVSQTYIIIISLSSADVHNDSEKRLAIRGKASILWTEGIVENEVCRKMDLAGMQIELLLAFRYLFVIK